MTVEAAKPMEEKNKPAVFVSLRTKLIISLAALFLLALVLIFVWLDRFVTSLAMKNLQADLLATSPS